MTSKWHLNKSNVCTIILFYLFNYLFVYLFYYYSVIRLNMHENTTLNHWCMTSSPANIFEVYSGYVRLCFVASEYLFGSFQLFWHDHEIKKTDYINVRENRMCNQKGQSRNTVKIGIKTQNNDKQNTNIFSDNRYMSSLLKCMYDEDHNN